MFNWAKQQLANVAGTQEPIYGPSAIKSVAEEAATTPYTEVPREGYKWQQVESTNVETQCFYFFADNGRIAMCQVIYNSIAGIRVTVQFNSKVYSADPAKHLWCSSPLSNHDFSDDKNSIYADDCAVELSEDGKTYTIKSMNDQRSIVNLKVTRVTPAVQAGTTGKTLYGTDLKNPWGSMRHVFWPRCVAEGTITTSEGALDFKGRAMYVYALQGMKPHHAAAKWNFANFQGPNYSAVVMDFTTPPSYGSTKVTVGLVAKDDEIVVANCSSVVSHKTVKEDPETSWPEPTAVQFTWAGKTKDGKSVEGTMEGDFGTRTDRVDVMAEVPGFVKSIVKGAAGTKPYIYQYTPKTALKLKIGDEEISEDGQLFSEATFIVE
jgi:hypothetical protein